MLLDATIDEVVSVFYEIGDFFADASAEIDQQVKLLIGNQAYGQTRIRVIKAHLAKLDRLQEAHEAITQLLHDEIYSEDPILSDEKIKLFTRTLRYIDQVKSTHREIKAVLHRREILEKEHYTYASSMLTYAKTLRHSLKKPLSTRQSYRTFALLNH